MARGDLTDDEWSLIEPHLPLGERGPIPDLRRQFNAVMWRFRTGSPWRDLPEEYGLWSTVYDRFRSWAMTGVFQRLMESVIAEASARGRGPGSGQRGLHHGPCPPPRRWDGPRSRACGGVGEGR
ncbi:transposase [Nonomuraea turcica]|uniref:transposase n=1 Tax=Nonomuraea sp. G32 TaxID=3067274 RepID=UPI0035304EA1